MKNLSAFILKVDSFQEDFENIVIDVTIEGFVKRNLRASDGWNSMIDNENKTFIFFVDVDSKNDMMKMIEELNKIPTDTPAILEFKDITDELLYSSKYDSYKQSCEKTQIFVEHNTEKDTVLEKIITCGGFDNLLEVEKRILRA